MKKYYFCNLFCLRHNSEEVFLKLLKIWRLWEKLFFQKRGPQLCVHLNCISQQTSTSKFNPKNTWKQFFIHTKSSTIYFLLLCQTNIFTPTQVLTNWKLEWRVLCFIVNNTSVLTYVHLFLVLWYACEDGHFFVLSGCNVFMALKWKWGWWPHVEVFENLEF